MQTRISISTYASHGNASRIEDGAIASLSEGEKLKSEWPSRQPGGSSYNTVLTESDVAFVCELLEEAGQLALDMREGVAIHEKTGPHDCVTEADLALSQLIVSRLAQRFTDDVIISEEDEKHVPGFAAARMWLIDPIDGTHNYIKNDGQYAIMIGLVQNLKPVFGFIYAPAINIFYFGGPQSGVFSMDGKKRVSELKASTSLKIEGPARIIMGSRDKRSHPWVDACPNVTLVKAGSIGIKVAKILMDEADLFVHLSGELKVWDTAGPAAIALGSGLEVGNLEDDILIFPQQDIMHRCPIIVGKPGSLKWCRTHLKRPINHI